MLFSNFLCFFYLMLICNGHTISKSIRKEKRFDELFDTPDEVEATTSFGRHKPNRIYGNVKRETDAAIKAQSDEGIKESTASATGSQAETSKVVLRTPKEAELKTVTAKHDHPSKNKRKLFTFWKRKKNKKQKDLKNGSRFFYSSTDSIQKTIEPKRDESPSLFDLDGFGLGEQPIQENEVLYESSDESPNVDESYDIFKESDFRELDDKRRKRHLSVNAPKTKRHLQSKPDVVHHAGGKTETQMTTTTQLTTTPKTSSTDRTTSKMHTKNTTKLTTKSTTKPTTKPTSTKMQLETSTLNNVINRLEDEINKMQSSEANAQKGANYLTSTAHTKTYETTEFAIDNIEELLNQLKNKQNQFSAIENPSLANLIMSTVTTTLLEGDAFMSRNGHPYGISTAAIHSNYIENDRSVAPILEKTDPQKLVMRSSTKNPEFDSKVLIHNVATEIPTFTDYITRQASDSKKHNFMDKIKKLFTVSIQTPIVKPNTEYNFTPVRLMKHDSNAQKLQFLNHGGQIRPTSRMSKRSDAMVSSESENLNFDNLELPESVEIPDSVEIPEADVTSEPIETPESIDMSESVEVSESIGLSQQNNSRPNAASMPNLGSNVEEINRKVWHSDYVNGYKYYLEYQKQFEKDNFSAQVKYQAHRHHKVDDIGKFILDKIPTIPDRDKRSADKMTDKPSATSQEITLDPSDNKKNQIPNPNVPKDHGHNIPGMKKDTYRDIEMDVMGTRRTQSEDVSVDDLYNILHDRRDDELKTPKEKNKFLELSMETDQTTKKSALKRFFHKILGQSPAKNGIRSVREQYEYLPEISMEKTTKVDKYANREEKGLNSPLIGHVASETNLTYKHKRSSGMNSVENQIEKKREFESKSTSTVSGNGVTDDPRKKKKFKLFERLKFKKISKTKRSKRQQERIKKNPLRKLKTWLRGRQNQKATAPTEQTTQERTEKESPEPVSSTPVTRIIPKEESQSFNSAEPTDAKTMAHTKEMFEFTADHEKSKGVGTTDGPASMTGTPSHSDDTKELENFLVDKQNYLLNKGLLDRKIVEQVPDNTVDEKDLATIGNERKDSPEEQSGAENDSEDFSFVMEAELDKDQDSMYRTDTSSSSSSSAANSNTESLSVVTKPSSPSSKAELGELDYSWSVYIAHKKPEGLLETSAPNPEPETVSENKEPTLQAFKAIKRVNNRRELENLLGMKQENPNKLFYKKTFNVNPDYKFSMQDLTTADSQKKEDEFINNLDNLFDAKINKLRKEFEQTIPVVKKIEFDVAKEMKSQIDNSLNSKEDNFQNIPSDKNVEIEPESHLGAQDFSFRPTVTRKIYDFISDRYNLINYEFDGKMRKFYGMTSIPEQLSPHTSELLNVDVIEAEELLRNKLKVMQSTLKKQETNMGSESDFETRTEPFSMTTDRKSYNLLDATEKAPQSKYDDLLSITDSPLDTEDLVSVANEADSSPKIGNSLSDLDYLLDIRERELEYLLDKSTPFPVTGKINDLKPTIYDLASKDVHNIHELDELLQKKQKGIFNLLKVTKPSSKYISNDEKYDFISTTLKDSQEKSEVYEIEKLLNAKEKNIQKAHHFPRLGFHSANKNKNKTTSYTTMHIPADYSSNPKTLPTEDDSVFEYAEKDLEESTTKKFTSYTAPQTPAQTKEHHTEKSTSTQMPRTGELKPILKTQTRTEPLRKSTSTSSKTNIGVGKATDYKKHKAKAERVSSKATEKRSVTRSTFGTSTRSVADLLKGMDLLVKQFRSGDRSDSSTTKSYDDYFNDLLIWHGDVLNSEAQKSTVNWEKVFKESQTVSLSPTPTQLQEELRNLDELLEDAKTSTKKFFKEFSSDANRRAKFVRSVIPNAGINNYDFEDTLEKPTSNQNILDDDFEFDPNLSQDIDEASLEETDNSQSLKYQDGAEWNLRYEPVSFGQTTDSVEKEYDYPKVMKNSLNVREHRWSKNRKDDKNEHKTKSTERNWPKSSDGETQPRTESQESETYPFETSSKVIPMRETEFEKFLKENSLDLNSVTAPLADVVSYVDTWSPKVNSFTFMPHPEMATHGKVSNSNKPLITKTLVADENADMSRNTNNAILTKTSVPSRNEEPVSIKTKLAPEQTTEMKRNVEGDANIDDSYSVKVLKDHEDVKDYLTGDNLIFDSDEENIEKEITDVENKMEQRLMQLEIPDIEVKKTKHSVLTNKSFFHKSQNKISTTTSNKFNTLTTSQTSTPEELDLKMVEAESEKRKESRPFTTSKTLSLTNVNIEYKKTEPEKKSDSKGSELNEIETIEPNFIIKHFDNKEDVERSGTTTKKDAGVSELDEVFTMSNFFGDEKNFTTLSPEYQEHVFNSKEKKTNTTLDVQEKQRKMPSGKKPHRFHISSHSYRYDIVYEEAPKAEDEKSKPGYVFKFSTQPWQEVTTRSNSNSQNYDSESIDEINNYGSTPGFDVVDGAKGTSSYKRQAHNTRTTGRYDNRRLTSKAVFVYSLKDISKAEKDFEKNYKKLQNSVKRQDNAQDFNEFQNGKLQSSDDSKRLDRHKRFYEEEENTTPQEQSKVYRVTDESGLEVVVHLHNRSSDGGGARYEPVHVSEPDRCDKCEKNHNSNKCDRRLNCHKCCCSKCCKCVRPCKCGTCNQCSKCTESTTSTEPTTPNFESIVIEKLAPVEICISVLKANNTDENKECKCTCGKCKNDNNSIESETVVILKLRTPKSSQNCDLVRFNSNLWDENGKKDSNDILDAKTRNISPAMYLSQIGSNKNATQKILQNEPLAIQFKPITPTYKKPFLPQFISSSAKKERNSHTYNNEKSALNKEFLNAINKQLLEIYKNLTSIQSQIRKTRNISSILDKIQAKNSMKLENGKYRKRRKIYYENVETNRSPLVSQTESPATYDFNKIFKRNDEAFKKNIKNKRKRNMAVVKRELTDNKTEVTNEKKSRNNIQFRTDSINTTNHIIKQMNTTMSTVVMLSKAKEVQKRKNETQNLQNPKPKNDLTVNKSTVNADNEQQTDNKTYALHEENLQELDNFTYGIQRLMNLIGCLSGVVAEERNHTYSTEGEKQQSDFTVPSKITPEPIPITNTPSMNSLTEEIKNSNNGNPTKTTYALNLLTSTETTITVEMVQSETKQNVDLENNKSTNNQSWEKLTDNDGTTGSSTPGPTTTAEVHLTVVKSNSDSKGNRNGNESTNETDYIFSIETTPETRTTVEMPSSSVATSTENGPPEKRSRGEISSSAAIVHHKVTENLHDVTKVINNTTEIKWDRKPKVRDKHKKMKGDKERYMKIKEKTFHNIDDIKEEQKKETHVLHGVTSTSSPLTAITEATTSSIFSESNTLNTWFTKQTQTSGLMEWEMENDRNSMQTYLDDNSTIYRNLLNSIFRYEMKLLKKEWERFLKRERGYDVDYYRNGNDRSSVLFPSTERSYIQVIMPRLEPSTTTKRSLLHKLASKISRQHPRDLSTSNKREKHFTLKSRSLKAKKRREEKTTTTKKCKTKLYKLTKSHTTVSTKPNTKSIEKVTTETDTTEKQTSEEPTTEKENTKTTDDEDEEEEEETSESTTTETASETDTESESTKSKTETASTTTSRKTSTTTSTTRASKDKPSRPIVIDQTGPPITEKTTQHLPDHEEIKDSKEACDPSNPNLSCMCDLRATYNHITENFKKMRPEDYERYVRNVTCYRYKYAPDHFLLREHEDPYRPHYRDVQTYLHRRTNPTKSGGGRKTGDDTRWDWIRSRRSLKSFDYFETYTRSKNGIYQTSWAGRRRKRTLDMSVLGAGLKDLPDFENDKNELLAIRGDTLVLECQPASELRGDSVSDEEFTWTPERDGMLEHSNVVVEGETISIRDVRVENMGEYKCFKKGLPMRALTLTVLALPQFHMVFLPAYETEEECRYNDLLTVNEGLATAMEAAACEHQTLCSIRVDEPTCVKSREGSSHQLRVIGVMSTVQHTESGVMRCSAQCRRDLHCSLAYLSASTIPPLREVDLVVLGAIRNRTASSASTAGHKWIVTHTLKRKDSNHHHEYHRVSTRMGPGDVDMVLACPGGFYLRPKYKICVACPVDTHAEAGANECTPCPRGWHAGPGAVRCRNPLCPRPRRYDWGDPVCQVSSMVAAVVATLCLVGVVCGVRRSRCQLYPSSDPPAPVFPAVNAEIRAEVRQTAARHKSRPLSPSRVILARLFRFTPEHSSKLTDSQETKLDASAEVKRPPSLPPIDFDF